MLIIIIIDIIIIDIIIIIIVIITFIIIITINIICLLKTILIRFLVSFFSEIFNYCFRLCEVRAGGPVRVAEGSRDNRGRSRWTGGRIQR